MKDIITGRVFKYADNINTDIISPPAYMELPTAEAAKYTMSPIDKEFASACKPGDIFVAGHNLGSGSSRETAPLTLKYLGIEAVVAKSFARIFYRNCINLGLLALECEETDRISELDQLEIQHSRGLIVNLTKGETYSCSPIPKFIAEFLEAGGVEGYLKQRAAGGRKEEKT